MRKLLSIVLSILAVTAFAQQQAWQDMIHQHGIKPYEVKQVFDAQMQGKKGVPHSGYKQFERWYHWKKQQTDAEGRVLTNGQIHKVAIAYNSRQAARSQSGNWEEIGPMTETNISRGVGRLSCIEFHPSDPDVVFIGSPSGGIWKTEDGGENWRNQDQTLTNFGASSIAFDPNDPSIMYAGTGDADASDSYGVGVWKSTDGGDTWVASNSGMGDVTVGVVRIRPDSTNILIAGTRNGLYRSTDAGDTWTFVGVNTRDYRDIELHPTNPMIMYASDYNYFGGSTIYKSDDGGRNWTKTNFFQHGVFPDQRYELEVCDETPDVVYGLARGRLLMSYNAADTFHVVVDSGDVLLESQGWYNACFEVDPKDHNKLWAGNVRLYRSHDGGATWQRINGSHADNHYLQVNPHDGSLWVADDGGIHVSYDEGQTYVDLTNMGIGMIYGISQSQYDPEDVLQGYQDCGSKLYQGRGFYSVAGADGMYPLFDYSDSNRFFTSWQYGNIRRHLDGYGNGSQSMEHPEDDGPWITPYVLDALDSTVMYTGRERIWKSTNIYTEKAKDVTWESISTGWAIVSGGDYEQLQISRTNPATMYAIHTRSGTGKLIRCQNIYDSVTVWEDLSANYPFVSYSADFESHPTDSNILYLLHDRKMIKSMDFGQTWFDVDSNLPQVPMHCLEIDTSNGDMYLGCDLGVYYLPAGDSVWIPFNNGLSKNAIVTDLRIYYGNDPAERRIKAATYGRGLWESDLYSTTTTEFSKAPQAFVEVVDRVRHTMTAAVDFNIMFRRNLEVATMNDFTDSDLVLTNASVVSFSGSGGRYEVTIEADTFGIMSIEIPQGVATAADDMLANEASNSISLYYSPAPSQMGYEGPGGVGDMTSVRAWFRSDEGFFSDSAATKDPINDMDTLVHWFDRSGHNLVATMYTDSSKPHWRDAAHGIAGHPAVEFLPINHYLRAEGITKVGSNLTAFVIAQSNRQTWSSSGWIANSRTPNGFVFHVNNNGTSMRSEIVTGRSNLQYLAAESNYAADIRIPHIYGLQWNEAQKKHYSILDDKKRPDNISTFVERDPNDTIYVRMGRDNNERWGDGKLAEFVYFNEDLYEAKRIIVSNYLASRYTIALPYESKYAHAKAGYNHAVSGIGRHNDHDYHADAKGESVVRISDPDDMEDNEYLMWGSDRDSMDRWVADNTPADHFYSRLKRTWRISESGGDLGMVKIRIDTNDIPSTDDKVGLAFSDDADFTNAYYSAELTDNGQGYFEATVNLNDRDYMAIVSAPIIEVGSYERRIALSARLVPNPSRDAVSLEIDNYKDQSVSWTLIDVQGKLIHTSEQWMEEGFHKNELDVSLLSPGTYLLKVTSPATSTTLRLMKQ